MAPFAPRNTATICLDGTNFNILHSYLSAMKDLDDWFRAGTEVVDVSQFFGPGHDIVRTRYGIFNMVFEYEGNSLTVPIEGHNLYLRGFSNEHGDFELDFGKDPKFIHDKRFTVLDIGVNYHDLLDDTLERTSTGMWAMRRAVGELCNYKGGSAKPIGPSVGALAIHISEAARSGVVHSFICRSIVDLNLSRLNKGKGLVIWIRKHSALSGQLLDIIDKMYEGKVPLPINGFGLNINLQDLVVGLRVCRLDLYTEGVFKIKSTANESAPRRREGLMPYKIHREQFATTSSGMSQMILRKNTVTEGGVFQGDHRDVAQETRGGGLMPHKTQNGLLMSQRTKAETPWTLKVKTTFRFRVDRILPKILSCRRPFRILQVGPPVTMGVIVYDSMKEWLNVPPRKGGAAVVDRTNCSCNAASGNLFRFFSRRETNWSFCPGDKKAQMNGYLEEIKKMAIRTRWLPDIPRGVARSH